MARPVFGQDPPTPPAAARMAYAGRHPVCGHVRVIAVEGRAKALDDFIAMAGGLRLERIPLVDAQAAFLECDACREPEQLELVP